MIIKKYPAPPIETAAERYDRDWLNTPDLDTAGKDDFRHTRTVLEQSTERKSRRYVDDGVSAVTGGSPIYDPNLPETEPVVEPTFLWVDNFDGPLDSAWTDSSGAFETTNGSLQLSPEYGDGMLRGIGRRSAGSNIYFDIANNDPAMGFTIFTANNTLTKYSSIEFQRGEGQSIFTMRSHVDSFNEALTVDYDPSGAHIISLQNDSLVWTHDGNVIGEITIAEEEVQEDILISLKYGGAEIARFGIVDPGGEDNGGGTPEPGEPVVPEGSYQENYTENY